jgi:xylulokinase
MSLRRDLVIGLDSSTTACKVVVWNLDGEPLAEGRASLVMFMPAPGFHEQPAETWWDSACQALRQAIVQVDPSRLAAIAISHQRETFVPINEQGNPLRHAILWMDERARSLLPVLERRLGGDAFLQRTGKPLSGNLAVGKIAWLAEHEPHTFAQAAMYLDTHAYLVRRLTGVYVTSWGSADPLGLFDLHLCDWDSTTLNVLGISREQLPTPVSPGQAVGSVTHEAALQTGLPEGLPVVAGLGDGQCGALGVNITQPGDVSLSLGTSVVTGMLAAQFNASRAYRTTFSGIPGSFLLETVLLGGAYTVKWFIDHFTPSLKLNPHISAEQILEDLASNIAPGAEGLALVPYWNSVMNPYWDPAASGIVVGWRGIHRPEHLYRAILEGVAFELRLHLDGLGNTAQRLIAVGGGARSRLWRQVIADVTGLPVYRSSVAETAALGAGILAACGVGLYPNALNASRQMTRLEPGCEQPNPENYAFYSRLYEEVYRHLFPALQPYLAHLTSLTDPNGRNPG